MLIDEKVYLSYEVESFLEHHGVKGQKWGIINKEPLKGDISGSKLYTETQKVKYGPGSLSGDNKKEISDHAKHVLEAGGALLAVGLVAGFLYKYGKLRPEKLSKLINIATLDSGKTVKINNSFIGKEVTLPKGTVFKRVSTVAETKIRPDGFYATYEPKDLKNYLGWGSYVTHLEAQKPIKIPSSEKTASMLNRSFESMVYDPKTKVSLSVKNILLRDFPNRSNETLLDSPGLWMWTHSSYPPTQAMFDEVKKNGYNALWDYNNMNAIAEKPVRVIDSSAFSIIKNEFLSSDQITQLKNKL